MRRLGVRGRWMVAIAVVAVIASAVVAGVFIRRPAPPTWQGKTAEEWFREFRGPMAAPASVPGSLAPGQTVIIRRLNGPPMVISVPPNTGRPVFGYSLESRLNEPSADGLRGLGTNAAVFLNGELKRSDLPLAGAYRRVYPKLPGLLKRVLPAPAEPSAQVRRDAALALGGLGTNAWPAMPGFISALKRANQAEWNHFATALGLLPCEVERWDPVLEYFGQQGNAYSAIGLVQSAHSRTWTAFKVVTNGLFSTNMSAAANAFYLAPDFKEKRELMITTLLKVFNSGELERFELAAMALRRFEEEATPALPAMIEGLRSQNSRVRYEAARVLEVMGTNGLPAMEALRRATNDPSVMVQNASRRALEKLEGECVN